MICAFCKKQFIGRANKKFCSPLCRRKYYQAEESNPYFKETERKTRPKEDLNDVVNGATEEGLSYGYYVAKHGV